MPKKGERFHIVPFESGFRVMADNGTFFSNVPLTKTRARAQQKALYAAMRGGQIFHGGSYTMMLHGGRSHIILKGNGFIGDAFSKVKQTGRRIAQTIAKPFGAVAGRIIDVAQGVRNDYPPKSRQTIAQYGDGIIESLALRRQPIQSFINKALDFITLGKFSQAKADLHYDKLFHLSLVATLRMPDGSQAQIVMEKNEVINIAPDFKSAKDIEYMIVPLLADDTITLRQFLQNAQEKGGETYFLYDAFKYNCQNFLKLLLDANELSTERTTAFILQPLGELIKKLPGFTGRVARGVTDLGALVNVAIEGRGAKAITMTPKDYFAEHKDIVDLLGRTGKALLKESKVQAAEAAGQRRKLEGKAVRSYGGVRLVGQMMSGAGLTGGMDRPAGLAGLKVDTTEKAPHPTTLTPAKIAELRAQLEFDDEMSRPEMFAIVRTVIDFLRSDEGYLQNNSDQQDIGSAGVEMPQSAAGMARTNPQPYANVITNVLDRLEPDVEGAGISPAFQRHLAKQREFAKLPIEEQQRISAEAEARRATLVNPMVERNQRVAAYNAEMKRRRESGFAPIVDGLTKVADFAVKNIAEKVGVPKVVTEAYKAFAPPGSEFYGRGIPSQYTAGLTKAQKAKQTALINKSRKTYEETGMVADRPVVSGKPTKRSSHVIKFENKYGFPITNKRKLKAVFPDTDTATILSKGAAAYASSGSRPNVSVSQWSLARLASVLTGGPSLRIDKSHVGPISMAKIQMKGGGMLGDFLSGVSQGLKPLKTAYDTARLVGRIYKTAIRGKQTAKPAPAPAPEMEGFGRYGGTNGTIVGNGEIRSKFAQQLKTAGINPTKYLAIAREAAEAEGYDPAALTFSDNDTQKLMIVAPDGSISRFGRVGYGDFLIWSRVKPEIADTKRRTFKASHSKIKGDWADDKYSPNCLALNILWSDSL